MGTDAIEIAKNDLNKAEIRLKLQDLERAILKHPAGQDGSGDLCPLKHHFADGVYVREMYAPAGATIVGKIHNLDTVNILVSGTIYIVTEEGSMKLTGPCTFVSKPGIKKAGYCETDVIFMNVHPNPSNTHDLQVIEKEMVSGSYEEYEKAIAPSFFKRILKLFK